MKKGLRMYEQREKPKEKIKANRPATRLNVTNKTHKLGRIDDDFLAQQPNGLLQRQPRGRVNPMVADYFQSQSSTIQRMAVGLPAAQMLALASRLLAGLAAGVTLSKSLQALNKSSEFERMTSVQKMMVYSVLYKVANQAKPNKTETLPAEFDAHSTTEGSEITEQGATSTSQPLTDQAILDLLGPIPASDDMPLVGNTPLPIVDDLGLGLVYSQGGKNESVLKAESKALDGSTGTVVSSSSQDVVGNVNTTGFGSVVLDKLSSYGTTIESEISFIQNLGLRTVSSEALARRARINEISSGIYQRQLLTDLGNADYVYRGVSSDLLDIYKATGKITDASGRPNSYFSLEYTDSPASFGSKVQVPQQPDVLLKIPVSELVDPKVPRPYWNTAKEGFEYRVNSYPKYGAGGNHQFISGTNSFSEDWIVPGWGNQ